MAFLRVTLGVKFALLNPLKNDNLYFFKVRLLTILTPSPCPLVRRKKHTASLSVTRVRSFPYIWDDNPDVKAGVNTKER